jgi:xanthine dehydrogenase YagR molybdenum-binding subunit
MTEKEVGAGSAAEISTTDQNSTPWADPTVVGKPLPRVDGYERVSGSAVYTLDLLLPDMLYAAVLRCPYAQALVKSVNTEAAQLMPGVRAVLTGADSEAQIILPYPWWVRGGPSMLLFDPHCRYEGEEIAAAAAETPYQVWDALSAIKVEYQELPLWSRRRKLSGPIHPLYTRAATLSAG